MTKKGSATSATKKGKPSGSGIGTGLKDALAVNDLERDEEISEKYTDGSDDISSNPTAKHPNRNTDKGRDDQGDG